MLLAAAAACMGCDSLTERLMLKPGDVIVEHRPESAYEQLFTHYVELCAVSQFRPKYKSLGGVPGHAVMYLKGACKDPDSSYPQLRRCRGVATDLNDPEHGAGVSVNRWFRNVNWIAVPSKALFYEGNLEPGQRLTRAHFDATVSKAIEAGVFRGVELHEYPSEASERSLEDFVGRWSLATDFALRFARTVVCARLPVTEAMLDVHTLRNALAAASVWPPLSVRAIKFRQIFNLAIPANEVVNLASLANEGPIDDYAAVYGSREQRDALLEFGWLPTRHGALLKTLPVHPENDLYDTTFRLVVLQSPFRRGQTRATLRLLSDERFVELEANLRYFAQVYDAILASRDDEAFGLASLRGDRYRRVRRRYYDYVAAQRAEVEAMLERLPDAHAAGMGVAPSE